MTVLATIIVLGVLIFVHELGHFIAAKSVDIRVERFSIGLGPKLFGFTRGETEYIIAAVPLGGYVKMGGMDDEVMDKVEGGGEPTEARPPSPRDFDAKPLWARAWVISAGVIMNMLFAFGAYAFIAGNWGEGHLDTRRVGIIATETLPAGAENLADVQVGSDIVQVGDEPIEHWGQLITAIRDAPAGALTIRTENPAASVTIDVSAELEDRRRLAGSIGYWLPSAIAAVNPGSPAEEGGLRAGDRIISVDGQPVGTWYELERAIRTRPGVRIELAVEREGQRLIRAVTPDAVTETDVDGNEVIRGRVGIQSPQNLIETRYEPVAFTEALAIGWDRTVFITGMILGFLRDLVTLNVSPRNVGSIVAIGEMSGQAAEAGLPVFLGFMAMFSVNLAILNLLPIPVLDGGHLVFLLIEAVRGKALSLEQRARWSQVGLVVILGIMVLALSNDVRRVISRLFDT